MTRLPVIYLLISTPLMIALLAVQAGRMTRLPTVLFRKGAAEVGRWRSGERAIRR